VTIGVDLAFDRGVHFPVKIKTRVLAGANPTVSAAGKV
jgi:hypothetical protein